MANRRRNPVLSPNVDPGAAVRLSSFQSGSVTLGDGTSSAAALVSGCPLMAADPRLKITNGRGLALHSPGSSKIFAK